MRSFLATSLAALLATSLASTAQAEMPELESIQLLNSMLKSSSGKVETTSARSYTSLSGRYDIVMNVALQSGQQAGAPITCYGSIQVDDAEVAWYETGRAVATRVGNYAVCRVSLPFSWSFLPTTARVRVVYAVGGGLPSPRTRETLSARFFPLPTNGAITTQSFNVRL